MIELLELPSNRKGRGLAMALSAVLSCLLLLTLQFLLLQVGFVQAQGTLNVCQGCTRARPSACLIGRHLGDNPGELPYGTAIVRWMFA